MKNIVIFGDGGTLSEELNRIISDEFCVIEATGDPREYFRGHDLAVAIRCVREPSELDVMAGCPVPYFAVTEELGAEELDAAVKNRAAYVFQIPLPLRLFADRLVDAAHTFERKLSEKAS